MCIRDSNKGHFLQPRQFTAVGTAMARYTLIEKEDPMTLHGYSPTLGIPSVKTAIAESLNCRFVSLKSVHILSHYF